MANTECDFGKIARYGFKEERVIYVKDLYDDEDVLISLSNCEDEEPNEHIECCSGEGTDSWGYNKFSNWNINCVSDFRIVKEWLEQ